MGNAIKSRILLVEDEPALRTGTERFLHQRGFTVVTATSGEEALKILRPGALPYALPAAGDRQPLEQFVQDYIVAGSLVASDKWWAYDELELLGYAHESLNHSKGRFAGTNQGENIWSVTKRHARKLFGGRILTRQLDSLCREWMES